MATVSDRFSSNYIYIDISKGFKELPVEGYDAAPPLAEKVNIFFESLVDALLLIWLTLVHALYAISTVNFAAPRVFKERVICKTQNYAKWEDGRDYIAIDRLLLSYGEQAHTIARRFGFVLAKETIEPDPYSNGHCSGNSLFFLKKWLETKDIEKVAPFFESGSPISGAILQESYLNLSHVHYPVLEEMIDRLITTYPNFSLAEEREKWRETPFQNGIIILEAVAAYLSEGKHPHDGDFTEYILDFGNKYNKKIGGEYLASVRTIDEKYTNRDLTNDALIGASFAQAGLRVETFYHVRSSAESLFQTIGTLESGAYQLSFDAFSSLGNKDGGHAVGLIIDGDKAYILDSNFAIGWCPLDELTQTLGRLFTEYTGFDYSEDLRGKDPGLVKKTLNLFTESSNPPASPYIPKFSLIKATLA